MRHKGRAISELKEKFVEDFVDAYQKNPTGRNNDDPINHLAHFVQIAYDMGGVVSIDPELPAVNFPPGTKDWIRFVSAGAMYLNAINPSFTVPEWAHLFTAVLCRVHGGEFVRIRKRPKLAKLLDADFMPVDRLMAKYGISRRHAFNLKKEAVEIRRRRAREK
ncbi:MAG: hypothetical protein IPN75_09365 [Dechloromonas sp.]|uniref:Uncharacterized protein n=1 Tax=Candidatus Dechloromonas phosphorivorans TaxID=2899244 RepID=A0A9D7LR84_9RHOO|nr:hypothetical protein [Candidatus Dechloromonas phosphorivorans]